VVGGSFDLAAVLAQLGRNVVEVERVVDFLFAGRGDDHVVLEPHQRVLRECEAALDGALPQGDVVVLRSGEILQRGTVAGARQQPDIHLEIVAERKRNFVLSAGVQLVDQRQCRDVLHCGRDHIGLAGWTGGEQVEIADSFASAAQ